MKSIAAIIIFSLVTPHSIFSQIRIGFTGGGLAAGTTLEGELVNVGFFQWSGSYSPKEFKGKTYNRLGFTGGIALDFPLSRSLSVRTIISYSSKGWREKVSVTQDSSTEMNDPYGGRKIRFQETFILNYLDIPAFLTFYAPVRKHWLILSAGPYLGLGLSGKYKFEVIETNRNDKDSAGTIKFVGHMKLDDWNPTNTGVEQGHNSRYNYKANRIDYGAAINAGMEFRSGFFFDFSFRIGLTDVFGDRYPFVPNRNKVVALSVGYYFKKHISVKSTYDPYASIY